MFVLRVFAVPKYSLYVQFTGSMKCNRPSGPCRQCMLVVWQRTLTDGNTSGIWSIVLSLGAIRVLRAQTVFQEYVLRVLSVSRDFVQRKSPALQVFRVSIPPVHICLYSRGSVLLILSVLAVCCRPVLQYSQYWDCQDVFGTLSTGSSIYL